MHRDDDDVSAIDKFFASVQEEVVEVLRETSVGKQAEAWITDRVIDQALRDWRVWAIALGIFWLGRQSVR